MKRISVIVFIGSLLADPSFVSAESFFCRSFPLPPISGASSAFATTALSNRFFSNRFTTGHDLFSRRQALAAFFFAPAAARAAFADQSSSKKQTRTASPAPAPPAEEIDVANRVKAATDLLAQFPADYQKMLGQASAEYLKTKRAERRYEFGGFIDDGAAKQIFAILIFNMTPEQVAQWVPYAVDLKALFQKVLTQAGDLQKTMDQISTAIKAVPETPAKAPAKKAPKKTAAPSAEQMKKALREAQVTLEGLSVSLRAKLPIELSKGPAPTVLNHINGYRIFAIHAGEGQFLLAVWRELAKGRFGRIFIHWDMTPESNARKIIDPYSWPASSLEDVIANHSQDRLETLSDPMFPWWPASTAPPNSAPPPAVVSAPSPPAPAKNADEIRKTVDQAKKAYSEWQAAAEKAATTRAAAGEFGYLRDAVPTKTLAAIFQSMIAAAPALDAALGQSYVEIRKQIAAFPPNASGFPADLRKEMTDVAAQVPGPLTPGESREIEPSKSPQAPITTVAVWVAGDKSLLFEIIVARPRAGGTQLLGFNVRIKKSGNGSALNGEEFYRRSFPAASGDIRKVYEDNRKDMPNEDRPKGPQPRTLAQASIGFAAAIVAVLDNLIPLWEGTFLTPLFSNGRGARLLNGEALLAYLYTEAVSLVPHLSIPPRKSPAAFQRGAYVAA